MDKKPQLFANKIDKKLKNNNYVYYSSNKEKKASREETKNNNYSINQKINKIFSSTNYIYKIDVKIKLNDKEIIKKIVGRNSNNLITMDNELIYIKDIIDIEKN